MRLAPHRYDSWLQYSSESHGTTIGQPPRRNRSGLERYGCGEPLVLVPGLAGGVRLMVPLVRRLAQRHEVFVVDHPAPDPIEGSSSTPSIELLAAQLARKIGQLGLERPSVLGVSFGALVALQMACDQPGACGRLILYGADSRFEQPRAAGLARRVLERFPLPHDHPFLNQFFNLLFGRRPEPGPLHDFVVGRLWETEQSVVAARLAALEAFDLTARLSRIQAPTLLIAGSRDVVARPARQAALGRSLPNARYRSIEGAGHIGFLTHRVEVARLVRSFLARRRAVA